MEEDLHNFGNKLNAYVDRNQPNETEKLISEANKLFTEGELSQSTIDTYLLNIFNRSNGILTFLTRVLHKPEYKKAKSACFDFLYTLVSNCTDKLKTYLIDIIKTCSPVVRSSVSANEKEKSLKLISIIILKGNLYANSQIDVNAELSDLYENTLYKCLHIRFDSSSTVHDELLSTIGVLTKKYPAVISNPTELRNTLLNQLNREVQKPTKSYPIIAGALSALSDFLENYPIDADDDNTTSSTIYKCVKLLADPGTATRRVAFRGALGLVAKHIVLLSNALYSDAKWWHCTLLKWFDLGPDDKKAAYAIMEAFYREMSNQLNNHAEQSDHELFNYFMDYFMNTLSKTTVDNYEMQLAIRGLGLFAGSFKNHITDREINKTFTVISQFMEHSYVLNDEINPDQIMYLPHYVQTLSFIIKNVPQLNSTHITCLERVSILMIKIFPKISPVQHYLVIDAFVLTLFQLLKCKDNTLEGFLEEVVYQGVVWTCSHQIALDAELLKDQNEMVTYKNYLPVWKGLLHIVKSEKYENYEITMKTRRLLTRKLFDEMIKTLFLLINKLNVNIKLKSNDEPLTNPEAAYKPIQPNDFVIFVNIVDLYQDILETVDKELFKIWINMFTNQIIIKSGKHPIVSGFYKLLAACLKVSDSLGYFEEENRSSKEDVDICYQSVCKFLQEVLWKVKQHKGDLQLACMHLILAAPICTIKDLLPSAVPVFISLFDVGRSYLKIAHLGIDALERWLKYIPQNDIEPFLNKVLPSLDSYLRSRSLGGTLVTSTPLKIRKTKQALNKRKVLVQTEPELFKLQQKILTFLGQLNDDLCLAFINSGDSIDPVVWNKTPYLKVTLPYTDAKLNVYLDKFVPRIVELALYSSDRKMRVSACELLHAIVMIILGTARPLNQNPTKLEELNGLMNAVAGPVLKLGCDMDEVIQQLYAPLAHQLMHYYSHPVQMGLPHTQIIIESLIDGIANPTDAALRDFSGNCIKEFVKWTIKQTDQEDLLKNPISIKLWIRTINSFSVHPDPFKRLGAALIFNNIYTILREEHHMFNMFWLEILFAFVNNLSLIQMNNADDKNCIDQVTQALNHVQRGLVEKSAIFNKKDTRRRKPPGFEANLLKDAAFWLLKKTGSINSYCRQKCMRMFCEIAPLVTNCLNSIEKFRKHYIDNDPILVIHIYETELLKNPTLNSMNNLKGTTGLFHWMQNLLCALDGYIFIITNHLIPPNLPSENSTFLSSLQFFLQFIQLQGIAEVLNLMPENENVNIYTTTEKEYFNSLKSDIVNKIMEFAVVILENKVESLYITKTLNLLWNSDLWNLLCHYIFDPASLGFDISNLENEEVLVNLLNKIDSQCPVEARNSLKNVLSTYLINKAISNTDMTVNIVSLKQRLLLKGILLIQQTSFVDKLNIAKYSGNTIKHLISGLAESTQSEKILIKLHRTAHIYWDLRLEIALKNKQEICEMIDFICNQTKVYNQEQNEYIEYGRYFFETFKNRIIQTIITDYKLFCDKIFKLDVTSNALKIIIDILRHIRHNSKSIEREILQNVVHTSLNYWDTIIIYLDHNVKYVMLGIELIHGLISISTQSFYNFSQNIHSLKIWIIKLLTCEDPQWTLEANLNFKAEIFGVLPYIIGPSNECEAELRNALNPLKQKYLNQKPILKIAFLTTFKKLLLAVKTSRSTILLKEALDIYLKVPYTNEDINLNQTLHTFIRYINVEQQLSALECVYKMSFDTDSYSTIQRYHIANDVLPSIIQNCYYNTFEQFYVNKINFIITTIKENSTNSFNSDQIMNKTIVFILIELLFLRIKTENFVDGSCPVTKAAFNENNTDKKLVKTLFQYASGVCKKSYNLDKQEEQNVFRLYQCHCVNALVSLISNTQKEMTFYNWLFNREENKQDILWKHVIDKNKKYYFDVDFDTVPSMKKVLVNIRTNLLTSRKELDSNIRTVKYIESQHLFNSTLSEDITQFDFSNSVLRDHLDQSEMKNEKIEVRQEVQLESIDINKHECMASICAFIQHIAENIATPPSDSEVSLPPWMKGIRNVMMADTSHHNVRIFFGKVIHNTSSVFKPYAKWFLAPIIKLIVDGCIGTKINFFITDLIIMLTSWSDVAIPNEDQELASKLLKFLMENADNDHRAIFKYNLENIKLVLEAWKPCLTIPYELLQQNVKLEISSQKLDVGIHLVAAVLANSIIPWHPNELKNFLMSLTKLIKSTHRSVYQPCAEVLGMSLKYMSTDKESLQFLINFQNYVHKCLKDMINDNNKFAYCLQGITIHYPAIADQYLTGMISKLPHIGTFKLIYLRILLAKVETLHAINELHSIDFSKLLSEDKFEIQILTLEMIKKSVPYLKNTELLTILKNVIKFINNSVTMCRNIVYDVFIIAYDAFYRLQDNIAKEIVATCRDALLQGLIDKELEIQEKIFSFWSDSNLPMDITNRLLYLLNNMYKANIEEYYVGYSIYLLLNTIKSTEEFNVKLFEDPLHECDFQDYILNSNWRRQHASIAPLFADTLSSQEHSFSPMNPNVLRATVSTLEFQPTQAQAGPSQRPNSYFTNSSSLLFNVDTGNIHSVQDAEFKDPNNVIPKIQVIRGRRFLKDKSKISRHCAYQEVKKSIKAEELRKDRVKQSERNVTIYRKYRIGDFPDIEIVLSSVVTPLQMLAKSDAVLARHLYTSIFTSLVEKLHKDEKEEKNFIPNINLNISSIFKSSTQFIPNTIGTFLDIALMYKNELRFDPNIITTVCQYSGLLSVGSLLLEEYIDSKDENYETPVKKNRGVGNESVLQWIKFAELHKEMEEWDIVRAVFLEKLDCSELVLNAIEAESSGNWRSAQEFYASAIEEDSSQERKDFYYESYFKCFAALAEWDQLSPVIEQTVATNTRNTVWTSLWDDEWNQQKLLPWYITAELRNILNGETQDKKLFGYINESLTDKEKLEYLKVNFGEELAMLWLLQNDAESANYYLNSSLTNFLENWSQLNPLFIKLRTNKILNLRNVIDIHLFLNTLRKVESYNRDSVLELLLKAWQEDSNEFTESLLLSETRTVYRNQFISTLKTKLHSLLSADEMQDINENLNKCKFRLNMNLVENAISQGNYYVARKYIKQVSSFKPNDVIGKMQWSLALSKILYYKAQNLDPQAQVGELVKSWMQIGKSSDLEATEDGSMSYLIKTSEHVYQITQKVYKLVSQNESLLNTKISQQIQQLMGDVSLDNTEAIWRFGAKSLQKSIDFCENEIQLMMNKDDLKVYRYLADAYVKLAYCTQDKGERFDEDFIVSVLRAMKLGSIEGKQLFPCLLNKDIGVTFKDVFISESSQIPRWMFLGWLPQLLANLGTTCVFAISDILIEIAKRYPQAIMYAYRLSKEKYISNSDEVRNFGKEIMEKLDDLLLHNDLVDRFLEAISFVTPPSNMLYYYLNKTHKSCDSKEEFDSAVKTLFDGVYSRNSEYAESDNIQGQIFKKIIGKYETKIKEIIKGKFDSAKVKPKIELLRSEVKDLKYNKSSKLIDYSPWLRNFQSTELHADLEIPGQYTGEKRPLPQYHIKIMGFSPNVLPLGSLRAPIRLTILGNDAKEYHYLIKFGEDLRQDLRIEQIFNLMNNILRHDSNCHKRQLSIQTYQVIPLNTSLGMIEWINDTKELRKFIKAGVKNDEMTYFNNKISNDYWNWMRKTLPRTCNNENLCYGYALTKYTRDDVMRKFTEFVNGVSLDVLRNSFWNISTNSESFYALRHKFIISYAVVCVSQWLLGIGDRHLDNTLISLQNGQAIGIDFGHAFGTATQILPIPELVPFRLTPHILQLLEPLGKQGLFQETMVHCLRAFRRNNDVLLSTLNVFIQEPSVDWLDFAKRSQLTSRNSLTVEWYPQEKMKHARNKLEGANPTSIMIEELKVGHSHTPFVKDYINVVKGLANINYRATKGDNLSEEEQVKCLLDHSTDYNLLGRMYVGWNPWI